VMTTLVSTCAIYDFVVSVTRAGEWEPVQLQFMWTCQIAASLREMICRAGLHT
jgi:hypothetical protein